MTYHVEYEFPAQKALKKMDRQSSAAIISWIEKNLESCENPRRMGKPFQCEYKGSWRYRVGKFRLFCRIEDEKVTIFLIDVRKRDEAYNH